MMKLWSRHQLLLIAVITGVSACSASPPENTGNREVRIAAAADLRLALARISREVSARDDWEVLPTYGSSGNFFAQISNGAPFDLFLSADVDYAEKLVQNGYGHSIFTYGKGRLIAVAPFHSTGDWNARGLGLLADPAIRRIAIANPAHAPYGRAAIRAMEAAGIHSSIAGKLVFGDNVGQAQEFVSGGSADAGLLALSLMPESLRAGTAWEVPQHLYPDLVQAGVIVKAGRNPAGAAALRAFVLSADGQAILREFGFGAP